MNEKPARWLNPLPPVPENHVTKFARSFAPFASAALIDSVPALRLVAYWFVEVAYVAKSLVVVAFVETKFVVVALANMLPPVKVWSAARSNVLPECEARVRGKRARFKKALSASDEASIVGEFSRPR